LIWFLYTQLDVLSAYDWQIDPLWLVLAVSFSGLYFGGLGCCWAFLLRLMSNSFHAPKLLRSAHIWQMSMVTRYLPGNVWHILSRAAFAEQLGVSRGLVIASATVEQLFTLMGALLVAPLILPWFSSRIIGSIELQIGWIIPATIVGGVIAMHPGILGRILRWIAARLGRPEIAWHYRYRTVLALLFLYSVTTMIAGLSLVAIVNGLTIIGFITFPLIIGSAAFAWAAGYLSIVTPSGLGVREGVLAGLLAMILPLPVAIVASLLFRLVTTLGEVLSLCVFWLLGRQQSIKGS
jgi:uncharacterized membrane protein YbhN (UPF0104 family)